MTKKRGPAYPFEPAPAFPHEGEGEHQPRALVTEEPPPASLYHFCPQCLATLDASKNDGLA